MNNNTHVMQLAQPQMSSCKESATVVRLSHDLLFLEWFCVVPNLKGRHMIFCLLST